MFGKFIRCITLLGLTTPFLSLAVVAQESNNSVPEAAASDQGSVIVIGPTTPPPPVPVFFSSQNRIQGELVFKPCQSRGESFFGSDSGEAEQIQLEVIGTGSVVSVSGEGVDLLCDPECG